MTTDNDQELLDEYMELNSIIIEDYTRKYLQCGGDTAKAKELRDKCRVEGEKLLNHYLHMMMKSIFVEAEQLAEDYKLAREEIRKSFDQRIKETDEKKNQK